MGSLAQKNQYCLLSAGTHIMNSTVSRSGDGFTRR
uniref:Uncharacterized protein n=1 Tax=Anguilla anguilla TaxID=7936 RepID=A0A0E9UQI5_ANGAN